MLSDVCASTPVPVASNAYKPVGKEVDLGPLKVYVTGDEQAERVLIHATDIFSIPSVNSRQVADLLAKQLKGLVLMPDLLEGGYKNPVINRDEIHQWIAQVGTWEKVQPKLQSLLHSPLVKPNSKIGVTGFCWGGRIAVLCMHETAGFAQIRAAAAVHPSRITDEDCKAARAPVALLPSKDEPDMSACFALLKQKPNGERCIHERFDDMHHGWCATRGDFSNPENAKRAADAINVMTKFFMQNL